MRKPNIVFVFLGVAAAVLVAALVAGAHPRKPDLALAVDTIAPGVTCPTKPDNGAFKLDKWAIAGVLTYAKYPDTYPVGVAAGGAIDNAFSTWEGTDLGNKFTAGADGSGTPGVAADGKNAVFFAPLGGNAIATTYVWYNRATKQVVEFDMVFNNKLDWKVLGSGGDCIAGETHFDVQDIATHEAGHVVGVAHTSPNGANNAQTMYPYGQAGEIYKRTLASGDVAGANAKY